MGATLAIFILLIAAAPVRSQSHEDLSPCPGSAPEPSQSAAWSVAFCNRTGHDVVVEFHDNDCPAKDWSHRGDVYQRIIRRGESKTLPLCYASEPPAKKPAPGTPTLRIPGGKGVVTTWNVVGDCGDRSKPLSIDARTFYDRGEYKSGIVLLQYPAGASHCVADNANAANGGSGAGMNASTGSAGVGAAAAAAPGAAVAAAPSSTAATASTPPPATARASGPAPAPVPPANPRSNDSPTLSAAIDGKDVVGRTVQVYAKGGAGYRCNFNLALDFTDGGSWNDKAQINITAADADAPIATRKYLKSVTKVKITSSQCAPP